MSELTITGYDRHVDKLFDLLNRVGTALSAAGVRYRVIGGMATFIHIDAIEPVAARLTNDIDIAISRVDLTQCTAIVESIGAAFHLHVDVVPDSNPIKTSEGIYIAPVRDILIMKLTSFRLKDKVHVQDLDGVGLITPEMEASLPDVLRERLAEVRATE